MSDQNPYTHALSLLERASVEYVVVGGFAVVMHGCNRFTPDVNVMVGFENSNIENLMTLLAENGFVATTDADHGKFLTSKGREALFNNGKRWFFSFRNLENPSFCFDLFLHYPVPFRQVYSRKHTLTFAGGEFSICSIEDLISMKSIAGRGQDKADIGAMSLMKSINEKIKSGAGEDEILGMGANAVEGEQIEGLYRFAKLSVDEKLAWLEQMLNHLGKFCVV